MRCLDADVWSSCFSTRINFF